MKTAFFGVEPRDAAVIVATIELVTSVAKLFICGIFWILLDSKFEANAKGFPEREMENDMLAMTVVFLSRKYISLSTVLLLIGLGINIIFLVGAVKRRHKLILPWIILEGLVLLVAVFLFFGLIAFIVVVLHNLTVIAFGAPLFVLLYGFAVYCWIVVIAAFNQTGLKQRGEGRNLGCPMTSRQSQIEDHKQELYDPMLNQLETKEKNVV